MRLVIFGDTGGHLDQLVTSLYSLGVNVASMKMPEDLMIVHVGDLIHKGPASSELLEFVDTMMFKNPGRWIQLLGNHEAQHVNIGEAPHFWECNCTVNDVTLLQSWWDAGWMKVAWGTDDFNPESIMTLGEVDIPWTATGMLVLHGGLTRIWWDKVLGKTESAVEAARILNDTPYVELNSPGLLLGVPNGGVGPVWAIGNTEVWPSWYKPYVNGAPGLPFNIVHGHTTSVKWHEGADKWWPMVSNAFKKATWVDSTNRAIATNLNGAYIIGVDPGFSEEADLPHQPYVEFEIIPT